jgi:regulator of cell morphogenesis and NO signaling
MITFNEQTTVGEIAAAYPSTVRVFQKHGIDFCCGGKLPLKDACERRGVVASDVARDLATASESPAADATDWTAAPLRALIDHIVSTHHEYLKLELPRLTAMMTKVAAAHREHHGAMLEPLGETFLALRDELESHLMKEEMVLFPLVRSLEAAALAGLPSPPSHCGSVNNPIRVMVHEHDNAGSALVRMRQLTADYAVPADACNTFRGLLHGLRELEGDLHRHIHLENNILFPRAAAIEGRRA